MIVTQILTWIGQIAVSTVHSLGYSGILIMMALESMIFPLPSELVMPFAGFLAIQGTFKFWMVVLFSSLGSIIGSLISYFLGYYGGNRLVKRWGKYFLLDEEDLLKTEQWFQKRGELTIFISRFIPVVRHLISIPAGIGKMNLEKFCFYTLAGATLWNTFLAYIGLKLGENWAIVRQYSEYISLPVAVLILVIGAYFVYRHIKHHQNKNRQNS